MPDVEDVTADITIHNDNARSAQQANKRLISNSVTMALANIAGRGLGYMSLLLLARHVSARYIGAYAILLHDLDVGRACIQPRAGQNCRQRDGAICRIWHGSSAILVRTSDSAVHGDCVERKRLGSPAYLF